MLLKKIFGSKGNKTIKNALWYNHPIFSMCLGICSALAITNKVDNAIAMGAGVSFVLIATSIIISPLRKLIPQRVRIISYMITISSFVIIVDMFLKAFFPVISVKLGPYVGLIITNCIIMGRAEAFYSQNKTGLSILDAVSNGISFTVTLIVVAVIREILGFGTLLGYKVTPGGWENWVIMAMAPGAFFVYGVLIWIYGEITSR
ncbi:NADH:ubiquinone reductase (Na(+)-transporting) subunit D [bacterium]|nr:NADH:ubiquinone reductase (Na(+)-transporting) subunit D [bacterium]